jgi:protein-disulfide isomerase/outer membrane murein-binding lipoprotein Lpp
VTQDAPSGEPDAEPAPAADPVEPAFDPPVEPTPDSQRASDPLWTSFLLPISVLIGAAAIVGALLLRDGSSPPESVAPALTDLTTAVDALSAEVESLSDEVALLAVEVEVSAGLDRAAGAAPDAPSGRATLSEALRGYAASVGLDADDFRECLDDPSTYEAVGAQLQRGLDLGVRGTPTFFINNKLVSGAQPAALFALLIAAELEGSPTSLDEYPEAVQQLAQRDPPSFAILPERPDASGAPIEGDPDAAVVILEFSDFECPFCQRWYQETLPDIRAQIGDDVAIAFLHFPLTQIHPNAASAHAAAECAGEQGKFWEMHDLLFERQGEWANLPNIN